MKKIKANRIEKFKNISIDEMARLLVNETHCAVCDFQYECETIYKYQFLDCFDVHKKYLESEVTEE